MFKWLSPGCGERLLRFASDRLRSLGPKQARSSPRLQLASRFIRHASFTALALASACVFAQTPGRPATPAEIAAWDIDVRPDFKGLPPGRGTVTQGQIVWEAQCESCHGVFGESNEVFTPIVGHTTKQDVQTGRVAVLSKDVVPQRTTLMKLSQLSTLWDYINRAMPWNAPKTLTTDQAYAVTAYILHLGNIVPADFTLSDKNMRETQSLLPNRNGKTLAHGMWNVSDKSDVQGSSCRSNCDAEVVITSKLPDYARNAHGNLAEQMRAIGGVRGANTSLPAPTAFAGASNASGSNSATPNVATSTAKSTPDAAKLAQQHACMACHGVNNKLIGPSLADIHKKYQDVKDATSLLASKIKAGGSGVWGSIPMPAQAHVSDADIRTIAAWLAKGEFR
jgi:S-disulfanyl-L-cysteine oxidoreductase SoxD